MLSTCGGKEEAERIGKVLVKRRLAACVNFLPVSSCYRWKGKIHVKRECLMVIKTRSQAFARLKLTILRLHSYELPEVISIRVLDGFNQYLKWIDDQVTIND